MHLACMNRIKSLSSLPGYQMLGCRMLWNTVPKCSFQFICHGHSGQDGKLSPCPFPTQRAKHLVKLKITTRLNPHSARLIASQVPPTNLGECQNVQPEHDPQSCLAGNGILRGTRPEFCITIPMIVLFEKLQQS